jgi:hypothetical protein
MYGFDPVRLGVHEATAWVAYYQRRWGQFLWAAVGMVRAGFGMPLPRTVRGAWLVLRANQAWAPYPDNDPDRARALMAEFYALAAGGCVDCFDVREAARLEVEWWRVHRHLQREATAESSARLADALAELYAHVYRMPLASVAPAAAHRAEAMRISDGWVAAGRDPKSPAIDGVRIELIKGYRSLLSAIAARTVL